MPIPDAAALFFAFAGEPLTTGVSPWLALSWSAGFLSMPVVIAIEALVAIGGAFFLAWLYGRRANEARERARVAEAEAALSHAEAEVVQAEAEVAQHAAFQSQQFAEAVVESAAALVIGVDSEGELRFFNRTAEQVTGYRLDELFKREWLHQLFPGEEFAAVRDTLMMIIRKRTKGEQLEVELVASNGERRLVNWQFRHLLYQDEPVALLFGVDLTSRVRAERERHDLERKLLDMQKLESLGVLAGGIAHDFNNLLTAILGNAQLAKLQGSKNPAIHEHLMEIERTSIQAADLCRQMLAYSGQGKVEVRLFDLNQMLRDMSQLLRISVANKAQLSFNLAHRLPPILGDPSQLRQVVMNLIINASEAIGDRDGSIWVSTGVVHGAKDLFVGTSVTEQPGARDYVFLEVADSGQGMDEETQKRLFDPFFTTKFTGRGLGLAAVLGIVRSHEGTLELTSQPGEGTTFTILFPKADGADLLDLDDDGESGMMAHWSGDGLILVIDDEESVRSLAGQMLESFHFQVIDAVNGRDGVEKFRRCPHAVTAVLLDVTMPVMGGLEAYAKIREIRGDVPVLFMSGYMREGELRNLDGLTEFLQKPFKIEDLQAKLRLLLTEVIDEGMG